MVEAACKLKNVSEEDFWGMVRDDAKLDLEVVVDTLSLLDSERHRQGSIAALPDESSLAKNQRYETHISRQIYKALHELQRLQAAR